MQVADQKKADNVHKHLDANGYHHIPVYIISHNKSTLALHHSGHDVVAIKKASTPP